MPHSNFLTEIDYNHLENPQPLEFSNVSVVSQGPLRASVRAEVKYGQSTISVTVRASCLICVLSFSDGDT